jgi:DNA-directed RNA polymerase subunit L
MANCHDVVLLDEDYTLGKVIEYILYDKYYEGEALLSFCGFKKFHPHDTESTIRIAYKQETEKHILKQHLRDASMIAAGPFLAPWISSVPAASSHFAPSRCRISEATC